MPLTDETLMAYVDGEVDAETRAIIESAMREDPEVRSRVERHRALRESVGWLARRSRGSWFVPDRLTGKMCSAYCNGK